MIEKLKLRFMMISISAILLVLGIIIASVNIINYRFINQSLDSVLDMLASNDGKFIDDYFTENSPNLITAESKYETRFFCVRFNEKRNLVTFDMKNIASISEDEAVRLAYEVLGNDKDRAFIENYRYLITNNKDGKLIVFVDCSKTIFIARKFVNISVTVGLLALAVISIFVLLISEKTVKPFVDTYNKQKKFIADAGHELKTPLTIISANAEVLELETGENESIDAIKKQVTRMTQMTKNLVALSRVDESDLKKDMTLFSLTNAAIDVCESLRKVCIKCKKEYNVSIDEDITYKGNERLIRELMTVVIDNAIKYSKSFVNIQVQKKKMKIVINVENDTEGINKDEIKNYTNRFYRTDESRGSKIEGSGIGLSIAKEIITLHKGEMKLSSEDGIIFTNKILL